MRLDQAKVENVGVAKPMEEVPFNVGAASNE